MGQHYLGPFLALPGTLLEEDLLEDDLDLMTREEAPQEWKRTGVSPPLCELSPLKESPPPVPHLVPEVREGQKDEEERHECRAAPLHPPCRPLAQGCCRSRWTC